MVVNLDIDVVHDDPLHSSWAHHHKLLVKHTKWFLLHLLSCCCIAQTQRDTAVMVAFAMGIVRQGQSGSSSVCGQPRAKPTKQSNAVTQILQRMLQHIVVWGLREGEEWGWGKGESSVSMFLLAACLTCSIMLSCICWHASHHEMPHFAANAVMSCGGVDSLSCKAQEGRLSLCCRQMVDMRLATEKAESYLHQERGMRTALGEALR